MRLCIERGCRYQVMPGSPRCEGHERGRQALQRSKVGNFYSGHNYRARRRAAIKAHPYCAVCGSIEDLTAQHDNPSDPYSTLSVLCRGCNTAEMHVRRASGGGVAP